MLSSHVDDLRYVWACQLGHGYNGDCACFATGCDGHCGQQKRAMETMTM